VNGATLAPGSASLASLPQGLFAYGGNLYFRAARFGSPSNIGIELWRFDGTNQTPIDLFAGAGSSYPQHFIEYNGLMYFNACGTLGQGTELWRYNGAGMPTEAARIYPNNGSSPENFAVYNGQADAPSGLASVASIAGGRAHTVALLGPALPPHAPRLIPCGIPTGRAFSVSLPTVSGKTYYLESKLSLSAPDWTTLSAVFGDSTVKILADPDATAPQRFYQVRVEE
jgi:ELWxxDGT repeat protein